jgi:hypothetical protein
MAGTFDTAVLNRVIPTLKTAPRYLIDTYFPNVQTEEAEEINFDIETKKFRLSPFVSPLVEGQIVESVGYTTNKFKPAYIKDKRAFNANRAIKRALGERITGSMSNEERMRLIIRLDMTDQINMLNNRLEWMAAKVLTTGAVTVSGDKYPTVVVSFGRASGHTVTLSGAARWNQTGTNPLTDLQTWSETVFAASGSMPMKVTMDPLAWAAFKNNAEVKAHLDLYRSAATLVPTLAADRAVTTGAVLMGRVQYFDISVYSGTYHDDAGVAQKFLPDGTVILAGDLEGVRAYGAIRDHENLNAVPYYVKSWLMEDPSVRFMLMQSAPLIVPYRPDATLSATVI